MRVTVRQSAGKSISSSIDNGKVFICMKPINLVLSVYIEKRGNKVEFFELLLTGFGKKKFVLKKFGFHPIFPV